ncbi:MAG: HAMP domain-containing histidine kinase [Lachnospiraceae bacterium]|nr:HAMP domain-containing histidine kinase [Lachnospiraceae bacterium]
MFRNREIRLGVFAHLAVTAAAAFFVRRVTNNTAGVLVCLALGGALLFLWLGLSSYRYRRLKELSVYLKEIVGGNYRLDLLKNQEGELSILRSDIYKMTVNLRSQAELLQRDKGYLADTLSDISHQLKTPMTSLMVMTELLADSHLPEEKRRQFAGRIHSQLERMEWLITSLLKMSRLDAGTVIFKKETVRVRELIEKAAEHLIIPMDMKQLTLTVEAGGAVFTGDREWTAEGLANILKNCMEHTPEGGAIRVTAAERNLYTEICVSDTGEGICEEDMPHIFERFYRGKNASTDSVGIGLAMAKYIFERQSGMVEVSSEPGAGTTFRIRFYRQII